ncbi:hypothetical protein AgCh_004579 [Apium graveolens]
MLTHSVKEDKGKKAKGKAKATSTTKGKAKAKGKGKASIHLQDEPTDSDSDSNDPNRHMTNTEEREWRGRRPRSHSSGIYGENPPLKPYRIDISDEHIEDDAVKKTLSAMILEKWPLGRYTYTDIEERHPGWLNARVEEFQKYYRHLKGQSRSKARKIVEDHIKVTIKRTLNELKKRVERKAREEGVSKLSSKPPYRNDILPFSSACSWRLHKRVIGMSRRIGGWKPWRSPKIRANPNRFARQLSDAEIATFARTALEASDPSSDPSQRLQWNNLISGEIVHIVGSLIKDIIQKTEARVAEENNRRAMEVDKDYTSEDETSDDEDFDDGGGDGGGSSDVDLSD